MSGASGAGDGSSGIVPGSPGVGSCAPPWSCMDIGAPLVGEVVIPAAPPSHAFGETSRAKRPSLVMPFARAGERRRRGGGSTGDRRAVLEEAGYKRPSKAAIIERAPP